MSVETIKACLMSLSFLILAIGLALVFIGAGSMLGSHSNDGCSGRATDQSVASCAPRGRLCFAGLAMIGTFVTLSSFAASL